MRHDRGAENADGDVQHLVIAENFGASESVPCAASRHSGCAKKISYAKHAAMLAIKVTTNASIRRKPRPCSGEDDQHVERGDQHAGEKRQIRIEVSARPRSPELQRGRTRRWRFRKAPRA